MNCLGCIFTEKKSYFSERKKKACSHIKLHIKFHLVFLILRTAFLLTSSLWSSSIAKMMFSLCAQCALSNLHVLPGQVPGQLNQVEEVGGPILNMRSGFEVEPSRKVQVETHCHKPDQQLGWSPCSGVLDGHSQPCGEPSCGDHIARHQDHQA